MHSCMHAGVLECCGRSGDLERELCMHACVSELRFWNASCACMHECQCEASCACMHECQLVVAAVPQASRSDHAKHTARIHGVLPSPPVSRGHAWVLADSLRQGWPRYCQGVPPTRWQRQTPARIPCLRSIRGTSNGVQPPHSVDHLLSSG